MTLLLVLILRKVYRYLIRRIGLEDSVSAHAAFAASGWIFRIFAGTPSGFIFADTYSHITSPRRSHSIDIFAYEQAPDQGSYIDEYTTLKEIGLAIGRIIACILFALLLLYFSVSIAFTIMFILAAIASAFGIVLERSARPSLY